MAGWGGFLPDLYVQRKGNASQAGPRRFAPSPESGDQLCAWILVSTSGGASQNYRYAGFMAPIWLQTQWPYKRGNVL